MQRLLIIMTSVLAIIMVAVIAFSNVSQPLVANSTAKESASPPVVEQTYSVQGDSLSVMSRSQLKKSLTGWKQKSFSAAVGRQYWDGMKILKQQRLGRVVVFALGTNSWQSSASAWRKSIRQIIHRIGSKRCLVMATIYDQRPIRSFNRIIYQEARRAGPAHLRVARWAEAVRSGKVKLADGVHPRSAKDIKAWSRLIAGAVRSCHRAG